MDIVALLMLLPIVLAVAFGLYKLVGFFRKSQSVFMYKIMQDETGNPVETVVTKTSTRN
jgi:uncharacterized protein YqhQ